MVDFHPHGEKPRKIINELCYIVSFLIIVYSGE